MINKIKQHFIAASFTAVLGLAFVAPALSAPTERIEISVSEAPAQDRPIDKEREKAKKKYEKEQKKLEKKAQKAEKQKANILKIEKNIAKIKTGLDKQLKTVDDLEKSLQREMDRSRSTDVSVSKIQVQFDKAKLKYSKLEQSLFKEEQKLSKALRKI